MSFQVFCAAVVHYITLLIILADFVDCFITRFLLIIVSSSKMGSRSVIILSVLKWDGRITSIFLFSTILDCSVIRCTII